MFISFIAVDLIKFLLFSYKHLNLGQHVGFYNNFSGNKNLSIIISEDELNKANVMFRSIKNIKPAAIFMFLGSLLKHRSHFPNPYAALQILYCFRFIVFILVTIQKDNFIVFQLSGINKQMQL